MTRLLLKLTPVNPTAFPMNGFGTSSAVHAARVGPMTANPAPAACDPVCSCFRRARHSLLGDVFAPGPKGAFGAVFSACPPTPA